MNMVNNTEISSLAAAVASLQKKSIGTTSTSTPKPTSASRLTESGGTRSVSGGNFGGNDQDHNSDNDNPKKKFTSASHHVNKNYKNYKNHKTNGGNKNNENKNKNKKRATETAKGRKVNNARIYTNQISVEMYNFPSFVKSCGKTKRFRVYKPNSESPKIQDLIAETKRGKRRFEFWKDGVSIEKMKKKDDSGGDERYTTKTNLNGLIVAPDTAVISSIFLFQLHDDNDNYNNDDDDDDSLITATSKFNTNPLEYEAKLRNVIFPTNPTTNTLTSIKVRCANCLLEIEPNGFVCIASTSKERMDAVIQKAYRYKEEKRVKMMNKTEEDKKRTSQTEGDDSMISGLHHDHAEYLCAVQIKDLESIQAIKKKKKNMKNGQEQHESANDPINTFLDTIGQQGVPINHEMETDVKFGHHLNSILALYKNKYAKTKYNKYHNNERNDNNEEEEETIKNTFIMIILMQKKKHNSILWEIDISGGKRYLGETSWECALRETEEETSLQIDETWIPVPTNSSNTNTGISSTMSSEILFQNRYYFLQPPADILVDNVLEDPFWRTT